MGLLQFEISSQEKWYYYDKRMSRPIIANSQMLQNQNTFVTTGKLDIYMYTTVNGKQTYSDNKRMVAITLSCFACLS